MTAAQALAGLRPMLTPKQGAAWLQDSQQDFDQSMQDLWESSKAAASGQGLPRLLKSPVKYL
ncbi:conserved hypothetical protein [Candidatus Glomeribacter gigasporarum BEG34]|uniref:Uncharacterized protein n=1 Tax=Candidatus Glomeribacter gigasporarum BEG34 TaxID=1070319 RepID=G2JBA0_9BURK|nr:hypothetical protein [Candidatus Glomeribacter gigasporarum]CCD30053.1 conserved hypothetical protein [Candidatus Glomeribacter gigasporarum BEG34]